MNILLPMYITTTLILLFLGYSSAVPSPPSPPLRNKLRKTWMDMYDGVAHLSAIVQVENARFTVLTPSVIRMEYSPTQEFDDTPTVNFIHRRTPTVPAFTVTRDRGRPNIVTISTDAVELYHDGTSSNGGGYFSQDNLRVSLNRTYPFSTWRPGSGGGKGNLHGTIRTLDRIGQSVDLTCLPPLDNRTFKALCEEGLISKDGWVVVDDSLRPRFDTETDPSIVRKHSSTRHSDPEWPWVKGPPAANVEASNAGRPFVYLDWYFFGHGYNFTSALRDYTLLAGPIPLLPKYALGPGFSRWYAWGQEEEYSIIQDGFAAHGVPLDALSVDMDWHPSYPHGLPKNKYNLSIEGWTGYTPYLPMFPDFEGFFAFMKRRGIYVTLNMHPAAGVEFHEAAYPAIAAEVGIDSSTGKAVTFDIANQTYAVGLFKHVLRPLDDAGLDYWWIDFQHDQFTSVPGLNPTFMCNYAWWTNPWRYGHRVTSGLEGANGKPEARGTDRPFIMGRFGGLGAHRYPVGFAGDTAVKWKLLRYETYFSPTASNVGFMWTHDIGGFKGDPGPELFTRWVQWGTFSALLRTHSSKKLSPARSIWHYANPYFSVMRNFFRLRAALVPYIATAQRVSYDTGLQLLRPMYYSYPRQEMAYLDQGLHQYFFGDDIWCAPIAAALTTDNSSIILGSPPITAAQMRTGNTGNTFDRLRSGSHGLVPWTVWVPPGEWVEWFSWQHVSGATTTTSGKDEEEEEKNMDGFPKGTGSYIARNYSLSEMPLFSAPGTIIPMRNLPGATTGGSVLGLATQQVKDMGLWVFPLTPRNGEVSSSKVSDGILMKKATRIYDDDGVSMDYEELDEYHFTDVECTWSKKSKSGSDEKKGKGSSSSSSALRCIIHPPTGKGYPNFPKTRAYSLRFIGTWIPSSITVQTHTKLHAEKSIDKDGEFSDHTIDITNKRDQPASPDNAGEHSAWKDATDSWAYHGGSLSTWVRLGKARSTTAEITVTLTFPAGFELDDPFLTSGLSRKVARSLVCKDDVDRHYGIVYPVDIEPIINISAAPPRLNIAKDASAVRTLLQQVDTDIAIGLRQVNGWPIPASHTVALTLQTHCVGSMTDASTLPKQLDATHPRYRAANKPIQFSANISTPRPAYVKGKSQYLDDEEFD